MSAQTMDAAEQRLQQRRRMIDIAAVVLMLTVPVIGFADTFESGQYLMAAFGGMVLGIAIGTFAALRRLGVLVVAAATVLAYFLFGSALALPHKSIAGFIPSIESLRDLAVSVVTSWKTLVTTVPPVATSDGHLVVPLMMFLVTSALATSLALRMRVHLWTLLPVLGCLLLEIALGTATVVAPLVQAALFVVAAVAWLAVRGALAPEVRHAEIANAAEGETGTVSPLRRIVSGAAVVAMGIGVGAVTLYATPQNEVRYVLREVVIPPFNLQEYPSPLQSFRKYVRDQKDVALFTVSGLPAGARVRLATMDAYNGVVYNVADASSDFTPIRSNMSPDAQGEAARLTFTVGEYEGVWVPDAGEVNAITYTGDRADALRRSSYFNQSTQTAVATDGLRPGETYRVDAVFGAVEKDAVAGDDTFGSADIPTAENVPGDLAQLGADAIAEATTPIEKVRALENFFSEGGFFSHGLEGEVLSRAGHGAQRIAALVGADQMIGDDEQYAVAMALMAGELGIPARVVMGFHPDEGATISGDFEATGDTLHTWVEVNFAQAGWVAFDPTPPEDQLPNDQTTRPRSNPKPQVLQPPPPPQEPVDLPPLVPDDRKADEEDDPEEEQSALLMIIGGASLGGLGLIAAPFLIIGALKRGRRKRRLNANEPADRISGGWDELRERAIDHRTYPFGREAPVGVTRREEARVLESGYADTRVVELARRADQSVFGAGEPTDEEIAAFWKEIDGVVGSMRSDASFWKRLRARLSLRSLRRPGRFSAGVEKLRDAVVQKRKDG